jgi:lipopolysaccharide export system permease protein
MLDTPSCFDKFGMRETIIVLISHFSRDEAGKIMPRLSFYVLKQLIGPAALFAFLMTCVVWLTQSMRLLDLVINRGQSAPTFFYLTLLILPSLLVIILPIAFFAGALYALSRLNNESELVVMHSAGFSRVQLALPVLIAALLVMALTYLCGLYLMPLGQREMKDRVIDIRADVGAAMFSEGAFNTPAKGLTVFIREIAPSGSVRGVLVHDNRNAKTPVTYLAETGELAQTPDGARLIMRQGTIEHSTAGGAHLSMLQFERYVFDLDQFSGPARITERASNERFLGELFHPDATLKDKTRRAYIAEGHNRIAQPLYCLAFALIALAAVTRGRRGRGAHALRMTAACAAAAALRIAGYGVQGLAAGSSVFWPLFYAVPLLGALAALAYYTGFLPPLIFRRRARAAT